MPQEKRRHWAPNRLWHYRKRMGFTQRQAAAILGDLRVGDLSHFERGHRLPNLVTALKLEILYRTPVSYLYPELYAALKRTLRQRDDRLRAEWEGRDPLHLTW